MMILKKIFSERLSRAAMAAVIALCLMMCIVPVKTFAEEVDSSGEAVISREAVEETTVDEALDVGGAEAGDEAASADENEADARSDDAGDDNANGSELKDEEVAEIVRDATAFSVEGNGAVLDDVTADATKEFFTITTENGNTFFLVIDRSGSSDNVYLLSMVDETDLQDFVTSDSTGAEVYEAGVDLSDAGTGTVELDEPETAEAETEDSSGGISKNAMTGIVLLIVVAIAGCAGAIYYFKVKRPKQSGSDGESEGMEYGGEDFRTENEDEDDNGGAGGNAPEKEDADGSDGGAAAGNNEDKDNTERMR